MMHKAKAKENMPDAKANAKNMMHKAKAKDKDLSFEAKAKDIMSKTKDMTSVNVAVGTD